MAVVNNDLPASAALGRYDEAAVLRSFFDQAPVFFVLKDADGRYIYINEFTATAQKRSDLLGKDISDLTSPEIAEATRKKEVEVLTTGTPLISREVFPQADGRLLSASLIRFPVGASGERLLGVIGLDVTELARTQQRQEALLDLATDAIHVRDLAGRITYWNRAAERLYGWSAAEVQGRNAIEILFRANAEQSEALASVYEQALREGAWSGELTKVTRGGGEVVVESRWTLIRDDIGEPDALLVIDTDITQKQQLEQQLRRAVRIDTIGSLAGGVAHDLNNMLMPILMGTAVIRKSVTDPDLMRTVDHLELSAKKAAALVRQILTFIRGSRDVSETVAGDQILSELQHFLQVTFPASVQIEYRAEDELPPVVCRPYEIHQVLVNLCVNARDAMEGGGTILVELRKVTIDAAYARMSDTAVTPGEYLSFAISDRGKGIPRDQLTTIFDRYFTTKEYGKGTGLGLSNAAAIVRDHGGFMTVESEEGKKTTFTVFLRAAETGAPTPLERDESIPVGSGETILVVDDEGAVVEVVRETLEAFGYSVLTASDGSEAIVLLARYGEAVRVIITDLSMPIVDGIALTKFARRALPKVKLIMASGTDEPWREAAENADAHLQKPYTANTLLRLVANLLGPAAPA
jgi:PAS domain S-box-containing protein